MHFFCPKPLQLAASSLLEVDGVIAKAPSALGRAGGVEARTLFPGPSLLLPSLLSLQVSSPASMLLTGVLCLERNFYWWCKGFTRGKGLISFPYLRYYDEVIFGQQLTNMIFPGWTNDHVTSQNSTVFKDDNLTSYAGHLPEEAFASEHGPGISKPGQQ